MVSSGTGPSLTVWNAASANETLVVMTIVAAIFVPLVLLYQGWSYWVFRQRLTRPVAQPGPEQPEQPGQHERPAGPATPGPSPGPGSGTPGSVPPSAAPSAARSAARPTPSPPPR